jgi:hypothetical protein
MRRALLATTATLLGVLASSVGTPAHPRTDVTWSNEIVRILQRRCAECHHAGAIGPVDLTDYADARRWANSIKREVLERRMPPWQPAKGFGDFTNDRSLTSQELELLVEWVNGGTRVGTPVDLPAVKPAPSHPDLEREDLILSLPDGHAVTDARRTFDLPTHLPEDRWITGWEFLPSDLTLVKQVMIGVGDAPLGTWTPGESAMRLPPGVGQRLPAGSTIHLEVHYREPRRDSSDRSRLTLRLAASAAQELQHQWLSRGVTTLTDDVEAVAIRPALPVSGARVQLIVRRPDDSREVLLVIPRFDRESQVTYRFRKPVTLPKGTAIEFASCDPQSRIDVAYVRRDRENYSGLTDTVKGATNTWPSR